MVAQKKKIGWPGYGLAWTEVGGDLLTIEAAIVPGKGKATRTGKLGDVMQESIRSRHDSGPKSEVTYWYKPEFYREMTFIFMSPKGQHQKMVPVLVWRCVRALVSALTSIPCVQCCHDR